MAAFVVVAQERSFTKAAQRLGMVQCSPPSARSCGGSKSGWG